jgi:hypothetical protein
MTSAIASIAHITIGYAVAELAQLIGNEIRLLLEDPVSAFLDDAAFRSDRDGSGAIDAVITKRSATCPRQHGHRKLVAGQLLRLLGHLRNVAIVIEAGPKVSGLPHLHHIELDLFFRKRLRVVGKIPEKVPQILVFPPFNQKPGDVHVHMHSEMPVRHARVDITRITQSEERGLYRGQRQRSVRRKIGQRHRRWTAQSWLRI